MSVTNRYTHRFMSACPVNGKSIAYELVIESRKPIRVESIMRACRLRQVFHEALADHLFKKFGGRQVLRAHHHGVDIETVRE